MSQHQLCRYIDHAVYYYYVYYYYYYYYYCYYALLHIFSAMIR